MNLSQEQCSTPKNDDEVTIITEEEEKKIYEKEVKLSPNGSYQHSENTQKELASSMTTNKTSITSELYQNSINSKTFLEAIWKVDIPSLYFKFTFEEPKIEQEERTQVPICFLLKYTEKNYIDAYFQIKSKETFPREVKENDIIYSNGTKKTPQDRTKENGNYFSVDAEKSSNETTNSAGIAPNWKFKDINEVLISPSSMPPIPQKKQKEYGAQIKLFIVNYCFGIYNIELDSNETKAMRLYFSELLIDKINNEKMNISIIAEVSVNKLYSQDQLQVNYSGLVNEGTTCYMNSLLQILYILGYFKRSIFQVKISPHQYHTSKIYSMQKLFFDLMCSENKPISTSHLIVSFGWSRDQMLIQHDVQEFFIILAEIMEKELKGTKEENTFKYLFEGKIMNQIKCIEVNFESKTEEKFTDLQLTIKNCKNIYDSFDKYTEEELLTGNDQYDTNTHGKQDAQKRIVFSLLPKVLILQLKRFEYNARLNNIEKINDRFEFYDTLDLQKYILSDKEAIPSQYECHAVIVHVGLINNGHYYCYIQPEETGPWFKFNDEKVSLVEHYEVFNNNFGGNTIHYNHTNADTIIKEIKMNFCSAYLLIYIRKDCLKEILVKLTKDDIPKETIGVFNLEQKERERERMISFRKTFFMDIDIITKEIVEGNMNDRITGLTDNIVELNNDIWEYTRRITLSVHQDMCINTLILIISQITNIPKHRLFIYKYAMFKSSYLDRYNYQIRCFTDDMYQKKFIDLNNSIEPISSYYWIYIHVEPNTPIFCSNSTSIALGKDKEIKYALNEEDKLILSDDTNGGNMSNKEYLSSVFYDPKENNWEFISHNITDQPMHQAVDVNPIREKKILVFVKCPTISIDINSNLVIEMKLQQVYQMKPKDTMNSINTKAYFKNMFCQNLSNEVKEMVEPIYDKLEIQYLIEYSCLSNYIAKDTSTFLPNFILKCNQSFDTYSNDAVCIVLSLKISNEVPLNSSNADDSSIKKDISIEKIKHLKEFTSMRQILIDKSLQELTQAKVNFICLTSDSDININSELNIPFNQIDLSLSKESLQKMIISLIKESLLPLLFGYKGIANTNQQIEFKICMKKCMTDLMSIFSEDKCNIIQICPYRHSNKNNYYAKYPLLEYLSPSNKIKFKINLDNLLSKSMSTFYRVLMCDEYSNPTMIAFFEKETNSNIPMEAVIREYIDHNDEAYAYYFVPFNPTTLIAYNILPSLITKEYIFYKETQTHSVMRYQPYPKEPMSHKNKLFICAYKNKVTPLILPFFLYCELHQMKIKDMKDTILNIFAHNKEFAAYHEDVSKLKFYKCNLKDFKPINLTLIDSKVDNEKFTDIFTTNNVINICVDLTEKNNNDVNNNSTTNCSNANKNYLLINE